MTDSAKKLIEHECKGESVKGIRLKLWRARRKADPQRLAFPTWMALEYLTPKVGERLVGMGTPSSSGSAATASRADSPAETD